MNGLPSADEDPAGELLSDSDEELNVDEDVDVDEVADLLDEAKRDLMGEVQEALEAPEVDDDAVEDPDSDIEGPCDDVLEETNY